MSKLAELHALKAVECVKANTQDKVEDEFHADLTLDMMKKLALWLAYIAQNNQDIAFDKIEDVINYFIENVYKPD